MIRIGAIVWFSVLILSGIAIGCSYGSRICLVALLRTAVSQFCRKEGTPAVTNVHLLRDNEMHACRLRSVPTCPTLSAIIL